jgi:hypothetical protein
MDHRAQGLSCAWFAHRVAGLKLKVVEGAITLSGPSATMSSVAAASHFLDVSGAHIARLTIINDAGFPQAGEPGAQGRAWGGFLHSGAVTQSQELLRLGSDSEDFLGRLGKHTRRNVRRAERIAEELGMRARFQLNPRPLAGDDPVHELAAKNKPIPLTPRRVSAYEMLIAGKASGFESRFTLATGEVVSYLRGYIDNGVAYLIYQANDPVVPRINLSLLHRFLLIERLIADGIGEIIFPFGCEGLLKSACETLEIDERVVIRCSLRGVVTAAAVGLCLPKTRIAKLVRAALRAALCRGTGAVSSAEPSQAMFSSGQIGPVSLAPALCDGNGLPPAA